MSGDRAGGKNVFLAEKNSETLGAADVSVRGVRAARLLSVPAAQAAPPAGPVVVMALRDGPRKDTVLFGGSLWHPP